MVTYWEWTWSDIGGEKESDLKSGGVIFPEHNDWWDGVKRLDWRGELNGVIGNLDSFLVGLIIIILIYVKQRASSLLHY